MVRGQKNASILITRPSTAMWIRDVLSFQTALYCAKHQQQQKHNRCQETITQKLKSHKHSQVQSLLSKKSRTITVLSHKGSVSAELFPSPNTSLFYCWRHAEDETFFVRQKVSNALLLWRFIGVPRSAWQHGARRCLSSATNIHSNKITLDSRKRVGSIELLFSVIRFTWFNTQSAPSSSTNIFWRNTLVLRKIIHFILLLWLLICLTNTFKKTFLHLENYTVKY